MNDVLTEDEKKQMEQDIADTKAKLAQSVSQDEISRVKQEAKDEAKKDYEVQDSLKQQETERIKLAEQLEAQKKSSEEQLAKMQEKLDSLAESKAVITPQNPFSTPNTPNAGPSVDQMSEDQVIDIEKTSMESFLEERSRGGHD